MTTTLIIATYNWPEALELVLLSILDQSIPADEIIIADDGSTDTTKRLIRKYQKISKIKHIWQEDNGFQKTSILNKAIAIAKGNYIIQIDGDIILHKHFISDHLRSSKRGCFIHGSRVLLNKKRTQKTIKDLSLNFSIFNNGIQNRLNGLHSIFLSRIISKKNNNLKGTRGCNFSCWKQDLEKVNGYNEDMKGWGKEDTELSVRLMNIGLEKYNIKCSAICYHLYHKISSREGVNINNAILADTISKNKKSCKNGINKYVK